MSEIKQVGTERDRQIAELRGEYPGCHGASGWDLCVDCSAIIQDCRARGEGIIKFYSTEMSAAMELWDEMRAAGAQPSLTVVKDFVACEAWINYDEENADLISNLDDNDSDKSTEAAAITECYINWKHALK